MGGSGGCVLKDGLHTLEGFLDAQCEWLSDVDHRLTILRLSVQSQLVHFGNSNPEKPMPPFYQFFICANTYVQKINFSQISLIDSWTVVS